MKRITAIVLFLTGLLIHAGAQNYVTIFTADSNIARPITIKSSDGTFKLYDEVRTGHLNWFEAYDANGNKIMIPSAKRTNKYSSSGGSYSSSHYHFTTLYPTSSSRYPGSGSQSNGSSSGSQTYSRPTQPLYQGNYNNPPYYTSKADYINWKMPKTPVEKKIINPEEYVGKWISSKLRELDPDSWTVDVKWDGQTFSFSFRLSNYYILLRQENENNWLFVSYSEDDKQGKKFVGDRNSDSDPGFPQSGEYFYDYFDGINYFRLTLADGSVQFTSLLGHFDNYYQGQLTHSETIVTGGKPVNMERYYSEAELRAKRSLNPDADASDASRLARIDELLDDNQTDKAIAELKDFYRTAVGQWKAKAAWKLGLMYRYGRGVECNRDRAYELFLEAFNKGEYAAACSIGYMAYYDGYSTDRNLHYWQFAWKWFKIAAERGVSDGYVEIGNIFYEDLDHWDEMITSWRKAAEMGNPAGQALYGKYELLYNHPNEAKSLFQKALENDITGCFDISTKTFIMLCDFFIENPQYTLFFPPNLVKKVDARDYPEIHELKDGVVIGVYQGEKMGYIKLSYDGSILASTPIDYIPDQNTQYIETKECCVVFVPKGKYMKGENIPRKYILVDINGNVIDQ